MALLPSALDMLGILARSGTGKVTRGRTSGAFPHKRLDIYHARAKGAAPVNVFFYGGSWKEGESSDTAFVEASLATREIRGVTAFATGATALAVGSRPAKEDIEA